MTENPTSNPVQKTEDESPVQSEINQSNHFPQSWQQLWERLLRLGLGETTLRILTGVVSIALILLVVWIMGKYFLKGQLNSSSAGSITPTAKVTAIPFVVSKSSAVLQSSFGISRLAQIHTNLPSHSREQISTYVVQTGDSIFGIADKFGLKPETILWSNKALLGYNPDNLIPGVTIKIPPQNGAIYVWNNGDGLNGVAKFYGVDPQVIVDWPANNLDPTTLGDWALPNIPAGTALFIPNAIVEDTDWLPHITRDTPAVATSFGDGFCGKITEGSIGDGTFIWPTTEKYLSGYDYTSIHHGIDIAGKMDNPIYAVDAGVVVYAGSNANGYGTLLIIDHGNGWQSVYGHLDRILVSCAESVAQGQEVALLGTTGNSSGPHLHFELRKDGSTVNPWDFLQQ